MAFDYTRIYTVLYQAYGDLSSPNFDFAERELIRIRNCKLMRTLHGSFNVVEDTDLNDDVCLRILVELDGGHCVICLSLVGPFALMWRANKHGKHGVIPLVDQVDMAFDEREIASLLECEGIVLMKQSDLVKPVPMYTLDNPSIRMTVYQALFSDDGLFS